MTSSIPWAFSHVGVTVPDLEEAVSWYREVFGMYLLAGPIEVLEDGSDLGNAAASIYGEGFSRFRFAHMCGTDGVGLELFHFDNPRTTPRENNFEFWLTGINHFAMTVSDIEGTARRITDNGGRVRSGPVVIDPDKGYAVLYAEDPWGTVVELCTHPYAQMWA